MIVVTIYMCSTCMRVHHSAAECETHEKLEHCATAGQVDQAPPVLSRLLAATPEPVIDEVEQKAEMIVETTRKDSSSSSSDSSESDSSDDDVEQRPTAVKRAKVQQQLPQQSLTMAIAMLESETTEEGKMAMIWRIIDKSEKIVAGIRSGLVTQCPALLARTVGSSSSLSDADLNDEPEAIWRKIATCEKMLAAFRAEMPPRTGAGLQRTAVTLSDSHSDDEPEVSTLGNKRRATESDSQARRSFPSKSKQMRIVQPTAQPTTSEAPAGNRRCFYKCSKCDVRPFKKMRRIRRHLNNVHGYQGRKGFESVSMVEYDNC